MKKEYLNMWEYKVVIIRGLQSAEAELNRYGSDGWELVSICGVAGVESAVFKRPKK